MDALFARYFDGDLNDREAREFLEAIAANPRLERELRKYERVLALGKALPVPNAPEGIIERVMAQISLEEGATAPTRGDESVGEGKRRGVAAGVAQERRPSRVALFGLRWAGTAAVVALAFFGGVYTAGQRPLAPTPDTGAPIGTPPGATISDMAPGFVNQAGADAGLRYVRLAYVPANPSVEKVTVVGGFNNWDPEATPLRLQNGVWSTILVLAPGTYEYMFFEDDARWVTDPLAAQTRDDGFGGSNAVLDVGT